MYIKQLLTKDGDWWDELFDKNNIRATQAKIEIRRILTLDSKQAIENEFDKLGLYGVINGT